MSSYLLEEVKRFLSDSNREFFECRHCGRTLEKQAEQCPECGGKEISQYQL